MPIMSSAEEKKQCEQKETKKQTFIKFWHDLKASYKIWIKIGGIISVGLIIVYLFLRFIIQWDLFYETDLKYTTILFTVFIMFLILVGLCWLGAYFLYNTKHKRNTKYRNLNVERSDN